MNMSNKLTLSHDLVTQFHTCWRCYQIKHLLHMLHTHVKFDGLVGQEDWFGFTVAIISTSPSARIVTEELL